ncbi:unnamed protein product [Dracunculus medinensis]|uniref:ULP_PROTEASE domain-containing protein n=1 Tax=Dracunculus medinensis TaxID=318479 RepID=A0A0N4U1C3_DRAME|nr:unnamed protein product [Dracunculus medinensis]
MPTVVDDEEDFWRQPLGSWINGFIVTSDFRDCVSGCDPLIPESTWRAVDRQGSKLRFIDICDGYVFNLLFVFVVHLKLDFYVLCDCQCERQYIQRVRELTRALGVLWKFA